MALTLRHGLLAYLLISTIASAQELAPPPPSEEWDLRTRLGELERELQILREQQSAESVLSGLIQQASAQFPVEQAGCRICDGPGVGPWGGHPSAGCCEAGAGGFYVGLDFAILEPHVGSIRFPNLGLTVTPDHDHEIAPRVFAGFESATGLGGQITYFELETTGDNRAGLTSIRSDLKLQSLDVDVTHSGQFTHWTLQAGAGIRLGKVESRYENLLGFQDAITTDFEGGGPTFLLNVHRPVGCRGWALVGEARASFLFGDTDINSTLLPAVEVEEHLVQVWEGRFGVEWSGTNRNGTTLFFLRGLLEAQVWEVAPIAGFGSDLGFFGPTVSAGFIF